MSSYYDWQKWVRRRDLTIGEFEDVWNANNRYEVAKGLLMVLPEMEGISREDKIGFLNQLVLEIRNIDTGGEKERLECLQVNPDKLIQNLLKPALSAFFELVPIWDKALEKYCQLMLVNLSYLSTISGESLRGFKGQIKQFVHSYLNTHPKKEIKENDTINILIHNRMFEELINYGLNLDVAIDGLWRLIFNESLDYFSIWAHPWMSNAERNRYRFDKLSTALKENREPHAVSTLLRLLVKKEDLEKIFQVEK